VSRFSFAHHDILLPKNLNSRGTSFARIDCGGTAMTKGKDITRSSPGSRTGVGASPLQFTPERALAAITFHLIDEGITSSISPESVQRTLNRLRHESFMLTISARTWAVMTNPARLRRLLEETGTEAALLPDDSVILAHRGKPNR
jgi:hypothetical protein